MRLALLIALVALSGCTSVNRCTSGTVLVDVALAGGAENADQLLLAISVDGGSAHTATLAHSAGSPHGTVEIDFPGGYPAGKSASVTVTALAGGATVGAGMITFALDADCSSVSLAITGASADLSTSGPDLTMPPNDLAGADFSTVPIDLAVPDDLATPHDLATTPPDFTGIPVDLESPLDFGPPCATSGPCTFAGPVTDFDVAGDGSIFIASLSGTTISGRCYNPDGTDKKAPFTVYASGGPSLSFVRVATARTKGTTLVSWIAASPTDASPSARQMMSAFFDNTCSPMGAPFDWPNPPGGNYTFDAAIDGGGHAALLWPSNSNFMETWLSFYDSTGAHSSDVLVDNTGKCGQGGYGLHVAYNAAMGGGVVTCQQHEDSPVQYRRFGVGQAFLDPALVSIPESANNHSSWYESHQVGVADDGSFVVEWEDATLRAYRANFYSSSATLLKNVTLGATSGQYYDGFRGWRASVELTAGNFVLRNGFQGSQFWTYSTAGAIAGCDQTFTSALRTGATTQNYVASGGNVTRGLLDWTRFNQCAPSTCGNGVLDPNEQCDDGNLEPYDGCNEFCKLEVCGDKIVTNKEQCDDGPTGSALCDATCHFKTQTPPAGSTLPAGGDFDVAADGTLITVDIDGSTGVMFATCYAPNHTLVRERFPVAPAEWQASYPMAVISRVSKKALVSWSTSGSNATVGVKLLDSSCFMVAPHVGVTNAGSEFYDTAIDDTGRSTVVYSNFGSTVGIAMYDATMTPITSSVVTESGMIYGVHVAMNQANGGGVFSFQDSNGNVVYYHRFAANGTLTDATAVQVPVTYVYWYDGHTIGMNDAGQFALEWRDQAGAVQAIFYAANGTQAATATVSTRKRNSEMTQYYDSFRRRHEKLPLKGSNFVFGETYNWIVSGATDTTQNWFVYTPAGAPVSSYLSTHAVDSGLNARLDGNGVSYFWQSGTIYFGAGEL